MSVLYIIISMIVLILVGLIANRIEKNKGEDFEPDSWAVARSVFIALIIEVGLWNIMVALADLYVSSWWYAEMQQADLWRTIATTDWTIRIGAIIFTYGVLSLWQFLVEASLPGMPRPAANRRNVDPSVYEQIAVAYKYYRTISRMLKFFIALSFGWLATRSTWFVIKLSGLQSWNEQDPIFGMDYSFYDTILPLLSRTWWFAMILVIICAVYAALIIFFVAYMQEEFDRAYPSDSGMRIGASMLSNAGWVAMFTAFLFAAQSVLNRYRLVIDGHSDYLVGAGYMDVHAYIPAHGFMAIMWIIVAVCAIIYVFKPWNKYALLIGFSIMLASQGVSMGFIPWVKGFSYRPDPLKYEEPYIKHQLNGTQFAFGLPSFVDKGEISYDDDISSETLKASDPTLSNARITDWTAMLSANESLNEIMKYYNFNDVDVDRYDGRLVMLGIRELNQSQLPAEAQDGWINQRFRYTHGDGFTIADVSTVNPSGEPNWIVQNLSQTPPAPFVTGHTEVYFGELTSTNIFVNGTLMEFGKPDGQNLQEVQYDGPAGFEVDGFRRLLLAFKEDDYRILFTNLIDGDTRFVMNRSIYQRNGALTGFLTCDGDPYPILGGEEIILARYCFTTSGSMPYSDWYGGTQYVGGIVLTTVGSYSGETHNYIIKDDPILATWSQVFPGLFETPDAMPSLVVNHLRYPDDLYRTQADAYALYHTTSAQTFYNRSDVWQRAMESSSVNGEIKPADPRFVTMVLPGETQNEYISNLVFTPVGKQNTIAVMVARVEGDSYGEVLVWRLPRDQAITGPQVFESRIGQDGYLSAQTTLWNQQGSQVLWGQVVSLVVPGDEPNSVGIVYVRSLYLQTANAPIPTIQLVIVSQGNRVEYGSNLQEALEKLYGVTTSTVEQPQQATPTVSVDDASMEQLVQQAIIHFDAAQACAASGDWVCYGQEMESLQITLEAMKK